MTLAISDSETDTFDSDVEGWFGAGDSVTRELGGPAGPNDGYLQIVSAGGGGPGSRMAVMNRSQWTGNYNAVAPVVVIAADLNNLGATTLTVRIGLSDTETSSPGGNGVRYVTAEFSGIELPPGSGWIPASFTLSSCQMSSIGDAGSLTSLLASVAEVRILSSTDPDWSGDRIEAVMGVDNVRVSELIAATPVFCDGFESGDLSAWSGTQ